MEALWNDIPVGRENAITYSELCLKWECSERKVRSILHKLSYLDTGDDYILIRSSHGKGFYKTDDISEIERYRKECVNRARHTFAPLRKIRRVIKDKGN
jgi:hypothetical protein